MAAQRVDCPQPLGVAAHFDKSEPFGLPCIPVGYDADAIDGSVLLKQRSDRIFSSTEAEISYKYVLQVLGFLLNLQRSQSGQDQTKAVEPDSANRCQNKRNCLNYTSIITQNAPKVRQ